MFKIIKQYFQMRLVHLRNSTKFYNFFIFFFHSDESIWQDTQKQWRTTWQNFISHFYFHAIASCFIYIIYKYIFFCSFILLFCFFSYIYFFIVTHSGKTHRTVQSRGTLIFKKRFQYWLAFCMFFFSFFSWSKKREQQKK